MIQVGLAEREQKTERDSEMFPDPAFFRGGRGADFIFWRLPRIIFPIQPILSEEIQMGEVMRMERKILIRYIILMTVLIICAAAAWYRSKETGRPQGDAVLAQLDKAEECAGFAGAWGTEPMQPGEEEEQYTGRAGTWGTELMQPGEEEEQRADCDGIWETKTERSGETEGYSNRAGTWETELEWSDRMEEEGGGDPWAAGYCI